MKKYSHQFAVYLYLPRSISSIKYYCKEFIREDPRKYTCQVVEIRLEREGVSQGLTYFMDTFGDNYKLLKIQDGIRGRFHSDKKYYFYNLILPFYNQHF